MFLKLKYILSIIKNALTQDYLESYMLMSTESDILMMLGNDIIITIISQKEFKPLTNCLICILKTCILYKNDKT